MRSEERNVRERTIHTTVQAHCRIVLTMDMIPACVLYLIFSFLFYFYLFFPFYSITFSLTRNVSFRIHFPLNSFASNHFSCFILFHLSPFHFDK